jgi:hypothetical protein
MQLPIRILLICFLLSKSLIGQTQGFHFLRFNQNGLQELKIESADVNQEKSKIRCLILYANNEGNSWFIDSLLDLQGHKSILNKDSFIIHAVELYKPEKKDTGDYCPPPSKLYFYGKEVQHASYAGGVWIYVDPESTFWFYYKNKLKSWDIGPAPGQPKLLSFKNNAKFFEMVTKRAYTPERLHSKLRLLQDTIWDQRQQIGRLNYEIAALKRIEGGILWEFAVLGVSTIPNTRELDFASGPIFMQKGSAFVGKRLTSSQSSDWAVTSSISLGSSLFAGKIEQSNSTYTENLGWQFRGGEPFERIVYARGVEEHMEFRSINAGLGIGLVRDWERWQFEIQTALTVEKVTMARFSLKNSLFSFGGRFPNLRPEDTIMSGTGDFHTNVEFQTENVNIPSERLYFSYSIGVGSTYWFSDEKLFGVTFGLNYLSLGLPFKTPSSGWFANNDIASYQPLWSRFGKQQIDGVQSKIGFIFKLR